MIAAPLYCPRIIGRERELAALADATSRAIGASAAIVVLAGEAGIGKTRLLGEFRSQAARRATCISATCPEFAPAPLGPVVSALEQLAGEDSGIDPGRVSEDDAADRLRFFRRACDTIRTAARKRPVVAIFDDIHWADTATLDFLQYVAHELAAERFVLVLGHRAEPTERAPLEKMLGRLARLPTVVHIELEPLPPAAVQEMVDATLETRKRPSRATLLDIRERSEGNPLFAEELLKAATDQLSPSAAGNSLQTLQALLAERLGRVAARDLRLLEIAATIGRRFDVAFLERVAQGRSHDEIISFLRLAIAEHFLVEDRREPGWFSFRHALVRDAILAPMMLIESRAIHRSIARELERESDAQERVAELSEHYWFAGAFAQCWPYARAAGDRAIARHAYREGALEFERAIACRPESDTILAALHDSAAIAHVALGNDDESIEHYVRAAEIYERLDDAERSIDAKLGLAFTFQRNGRSEDAFAVLAEAAAIEARAPDDRLRVRILVQVAQLRMMMSHWQQVGDAIAAAEPLLAHATPRDLFRFYSSRGALRFFFSRDYEAGIADSRTAVEHAEAVGTLTIRLAARTNLAHHAGRAGRLASSIAAYEEALALVTTHGELYTAARTRAFYVLALISAGRLSDARAHLYELLAEGHQSVSVASIIAAGAVRLSTIMREEALALRSDALETLARAFASADFRTWGDLAAAVAERHAADGNERAATGVLGQMLAGMPRDENASFLLLPVAAYCGPEQIAMVAPKLPEWRASPSPLTRAWAHLYEAYVAARFGTPAQTLAHADAAAEAFAALGMPLLEAEAHVLANRRGRATALMDAVGARRLERRIAPAAGNVEVRAKALTAREREVAKLAVEGLSNRAIAARLCVTERTVESHLAAVYAKTGIGSRGELVAAMRDAPETTIAAANAYS